MKISLHNVTTGYPGKAVTEGITAALPQGRLTCLLGPNGAGKSTLMKTLCGFIRPLAGSVELDGVNLSAMTARKIAQSIGVVLTDRLTAADMTVYDLVALGRSPYTGFFGGLSAADHRIVEESLALIGIFAFAGRRVLSLSDGERQKAMIAKALAQQTPAVFLDEPTAFLDYPSKIEIMRLLLRLAHQEGKTVFMSTHDLDLAVQLADSIWLLDKGVPLRTGVPIPLTFDSPLSPDKIAATPSFASILTPLLRWD